MGFKTSEKVGRGPCPSCGEPVMFRKSSGGKLTHTCDSCDSTGYAEPGGDAFAKRMASIKVMAAPEGPAATEPERTTPEPTEAPRKRVNSAFSMESLS